jgi:hypothetical protein
VAAAARADVAQWISMVMAPLANTTGASSPPLVRSDDDNADVREPNVVELSGEEPSCSR